jgi:hypothetical protein
LRRAQLTAGGHIAHAEIRHRRNASFLRDARRFADLKRRCDVPAVNLVPDGLSV